MECKRVEDLKGKPLRVYESPVTVKSQVENENGICATSGDPLHQNKVEIQASEQDQGDIIDVSDNTKNEWY